MPRTTEELEVIEKPKRALTKRARSTSVDEASKPKSIPRKKVVTESRLEIPTRKAPTPLAIARTKKQSARKQIGIIILILVLGIGSSAAFGLSDKGQIDVAKAIADRNTQASVDNPNAIMVPVQSTTQEPDGGLMGLGIGGAEESTTTSSSTASSTATVASSTEPTGQTPLTNAEAQAAAAEFTENATE